MSEKRRLIRKIIDRCFPELAGMEDRLKPINSPETALEEKMRLVGNLLKEETPNFDALLCDRSRRRKVHRGHFLKMGVGDWKIYDNDTDLLYQAIRLRDYIDLRLIVMEGHAFARLCTRLEERQAPLDKIRYDRIDATRFFSLPPAPGQKFGR